MGKGSLAKQIQSSFDQSLPNPRVLCLSHAVVSFCLPRTLLGPIL